MPSQLPEPAHRRAAGGRGIRPRPLVLVRIGDRAAGPFPALSIVDSQRHVLGAVARSQRDGPVRQDLHVRYPLRRAPSARDSHRGGWIAVRAPALYEV